MRSTLGESLLKPVLYCALFASVFFLGCGSSVPQTPESEHPAIAEARKSLVLSKLVQHMKQAGWEVSALDSASVETSMAPVSEDSAAEVESTRVVLHANRANAQGLSTAQVDIFFAPGNGAEGAIALDPKSDESKALLKNEPLMPDVETANEPAMDQGLRQELSAAACHGVGGACPCCAGLYCGYNYSSNLHCYCQRTSWTCSYTSSWGSGSGACRSRENPGGIYHVITWRTGCQNGTAWYADWRGNGIICPTPQTASGGYPVCGRP